MLQLKDTAVDHLRNYKSSGLAVLVSYATVLNNQFTILVTSCLSTSPEVVPSQVQHPGGDRGDAGGAALAVVAGDSVCVEAVDGRVCSLAGPQRGGHQHRHAAVGHRRGKNLHAV